MSSLYNFTLSDTSPMILYDPSPDGPITSTWNLTFSGSPHSSWSENQTNVGIGQSAHRTFASALFTIHWVGTGIILHGIGSNGSYSTMVQKGSPDVSSGTPPAGATPGVLASYTGLTYGTYTTLLQTKGIDLVSFTGATITAVIDSSTQPSNLSTVDSMDVRSTFLNAGPDWQPELEVVAPNYTTLLTYSSGSTMSFVLSFAEGFVVIGAVHSQEDAYSVIVTPNSGSGSIIHFKGNASSSWTDLNVVKYFQLDMDWTVNYTVEIINEATGFPKFLDVSEIMVFRHPPRSLPPSEGTVVGAIVGGCVFIALLILVMLWICARRRKRFNRDAPGSAPAPFMLKVDMPWESRTSRRLPILKSSVAHITSRTTQQVNTSSLNPSQPSNRTSPDVTGSISGQADAVIREIDAGPVNLQQVFPPEYNAAWVTGRPSSEEPPA